MRFRKLFRKKENSISKKLPIRFKNVLRSILIWNNRSRLAGEDKRKSLKKLLISWEFKVCSFILRQKSKCKTIFKTLKNAMKKWKHYISSILKNWITTSRFLRKRKKKIMRTMNNLKRNNLYWIHVTWICENNTKRKIKSSKKPIKTWQQITRE